MASLQLHDYHGALSLLYLPHQLPLRVLLVAHNADYNGTWHLGTAVSYLCVCLTTCTGECSRRAGGAQQHGSSSADHESSRHLVTPTR